MSTLTTGKNYIRVELEPEEILHFINQGHFLDDTIRSEVWRKLNTHTPKLMKGKEWRYGDVTVIDGKFSVAFFHDPVDIPKPPEGP